MASCSGQEIIEPVHGPTGEESNGAATAAAEPPSPPAATPVEDFEGRVHERPGDGGGATSPAAVEEAEAAAAAAADRKGKKPADPSSSSSNSPSSSTGSSSPRVAEEVVSGKEVNQVLKVSWKEPVVVEVEEVTPADLRNVFDGMVKERKAQRKLEPQESTIDEIIRQLKGQTKLPIIWPEKKKSVLSKVKGGMKNMVLRRLRWYMHHSNRYYRFMRPHVDPLVVSMAYMTKHYAILREKIVVNSNEQHLCGAYSGFRPVLGDGECFYRSFIFSYLEQVLGRKDTHEEHRLLAAIKEVDRQRGCVAWASEFSEFSKSRKAFKKLIKKVMRWKRLGRWTRHGRWMRVPTSNRYRREKLVEFFSGYDKTEHIFAFLRLVTAIWICSHWEDYVPRIPDLRENYTLIDWCFHEVILERSYADHVQMTALATALEVPLRVENLLQGVGQDLYTSQDPEDDVPRSTCWPHRLHRLPPDHEVPRVSLLFSNGHYDIIYPHLGDGEQCKDECSTSTSSSGERSRQFYSRLLDDEGCSEGTGPIQGECTSSSGEGL